MRRSVIVWREEDRAERLAQLYRREGEQELRPRWQALWLLRRGRSRAEVCDVVGVKPRALRNWIRWYRSGGTEEVRRHRQGGDGRAPWLTAEQHQEIIARASQGEFSVIAQVRHFVEAQWGVRYSYWGMRSVLDRLRIHPHVPRPVAADADLTAQEAWKRGGCERRCSPKGRAQSR